MMDESSQLQLHGCPNAKTSNQKSSVRIFNTTVTRNTGHGLLILVDSKCNNHNVEIDQVIFRENYNSTTPHFSNWLRSFSYNGDFNVF